MSVTITSTTDSDEAVTAALGDQKEKAVETKSASEEKSTDETPDESETSETEDEKLEQDESSGDESESEDEDKPVKKNGFKKRIDKLSKAKADAVREKADAVREMEYWKQQALKGQPGQETKNETPKKQEQAASDQEPKADDYETYAKYLDAVVQFKLDSKEKLQAKSKAESEQKEKLMSSQKRVFEASRKFAESHEDFDDLIADVDDIEPAPAMLELFFESENAPALMYELAKDKAEYERINKLSPIALAKEIGKIEARLSNSSDAKSETKTTKAPAPISTVKAKSSQGSKEPGQMEYQEYKKWRESQLRR